MKKSEIIRGLEEENYEMLHMILEGRGLAWEIENIDAVTTEIRDRRQARNRAEAEAMSEARRTVAAMVLA